MRRPFGNIMHDDVVDDDNNPFEYEYYEYDDGVDCLIPENQAWQLWATTTDYVERLLDMMPALPPLPSAEELQTNTRRCK